MTYYSIDEQTARLSHDMMSFSDYEEGSATAEYRALVDDAAKLAEQQRAKKPEYADAIDALLDRYARKLAEWMNTESRIGTMCPSILIAGGSNFPVRKKERQNARWEAHMAKRAAIDALLQKMRTIGTGGIKAGDERALVKLAAKLEDLQELQETMKGVNAYWRKNKTLDGCDLLTPEQIETIKASMARSYRVSPVPFEAFTLSNNNAEIHRIKARIAEIEAVKACGDSEQEVEGTDGLRVVEDTSIMRIQLIFDGKPEAAIRDILKEHGFRWAPSQGAWQRQLNANGKLSSERAIKEIKSRACG